MRPRFTFFWCLPLVLVMGFPALALAAGNATLYLITLATVLCYVGLVAAAFAILARKSRAPPSAPPSWPSAADRSGTPGIPTIRSVPGGRPPWERGIALRTDGAKGRPARHSGAGSGRALRSG